MTSPYHLVPISLTEANRAAGWRILAHRPAHKGWTGVRRPTGGGVARTLWEAS